MRSIDIGASAGLFWLGLIAASVIAWFTHIIVCIQTEAWGLLIAGAIMFPIGIFHGVGTWFGFF